MRTISQSDRNLLAAFFGLHVSVQVRDADGSWVDLSQLGGLDWFESAQWTSDVDQPVMSGTVELRRESQGFSLAPLLASSQLNRDASGQYAPLLYPGRPGGGIKILIAIAIPTVRPDPATDFTEVFLGKIDYVDWASSDSVVQIQIRDLGAYLQDAQIETPTVYSTAAGQPVETVMQKMLDDWLGVGAVTLLVPISPGWVITPFEQQTTNVLDGIRALALQIGWDVRYKYDPNGQFRLTLYDPRAVKVLRDTSFGPAEYLDVKNLNVSDSDVRNVVEVLYSPAVP